MTMRWVSVEDGKGEGEGQWDYAAAASNRFFDADNNYSSFILTNSVVKSTVVFVVGGGGEGGGGGGEGGGGGGGGGGRGGALVRLKILLIADLQCAIIVFSLIGNGLVVGAVLSSHRLRGSVTNYFVASLAVADLAVAVFVMPYSVVYDVVETWIFGWVLCYCWISFDVMCCTASILHLCLIAVDRYLAIDVPLTYAARMAGSVRRAKLAIAGVWLCSAAISFVPIFMGLFADETVELYSNSPVCGLHVNGVYAVVSAGTSFYLPLAVMAVVYWKIFRIARRQSMEISRLERSLERNSPAQARRSTTTRDLKAVKTLGTLMGLFCLSWLPFFVVYVLKPFCPVDVCSFPAVLVQAITWLGYCNSFFNPCVYGLMNRDFRSAYKRILLGGARALRQRRKRTRPKSLNERNRAMTLSTNRVMRGPPHGDRNQIKKDGERWPSQRGAGPDGGVEFQPPNDEYELK